ncbi:hypothetical protein [Pseudochryseolinea flava]|uniref:Uncharacterized protein n=1 Tax=Pseudochryseolinea flava TaxID=2059302 RepID=A0A364Y7V4_9BACT|nr:hypothetical protein [Pseudochryseolinea flava]RAW03030.1 hypothetical protein DQQ10_02725 [Pseudochryseolinea flava]
MIKDITIPEVKNVTLAVVRIKNIGEQDEWKVYLINSNDHAIENTLVSSKGYGEKEGEQQKTSILRHYLATIDAHAAVLIEPIDPALFHLNNEYWVSYYIGTQIFDKRFVFVPDTIDEKNLTFIKELEMEGVLHS